MRHRVAGRKLGRTSEHRLAMLRNMSTSLFDREKIKTTLAKAKELRPFAERLLTMSKRETLHARRQVLRHIKDPKVVAKMFDSLSARYAQRPGGYTRVLKARRRVGDAAPWRGCRDSRVGRGRPGVNPNAGRQEIVGVLRLRGKHRDFSTSPRLVRYPG